MRRKVKKIGVFFWDPDLYSTPHTTGGRGGSRILQRITVYLGTYGRGRITPHRGYGRP